MVQMLVRQDGPLLRSKPPKEAMRMRRAPLGPGLTKSGNQAAQPLPLCLKISIVAHDQVLRGRRIRTHRCVIFKHERLYKCPNNPPHKHSRRSFVSHSPLHTGRTMCRRLRRTHLAPQPLAIRPQPRNPQLDFFRRCRFKKVLHRSSKLPQHPRPQGAKRAAKPGYRSPRPSPKRRACQSSPYR